MRIHDTGLIESFSVNKRILLYLGEGRSEHSGHGPELSRQDQPPTGHQVYNATLTYFYFFLYLKRYRYLQSAL
jgi:hypothetical protein